MHFHNNLIFLTSNDLINCNIIEYFGFAPCMQYLNRTQNVKSVFYIIHVIR